MLTAGSSCTLCAGPPLSHLTCFFTFCSRTQPHTLPQSNYRTSVGRNSCVVRCVVKHLAGWEKKGKWFIARTRIRSFFFIIIILIFNLPAHILITFGWSGWVYQLLVGRKKRKSFGHIHISSDRNKPSCSFADYQTQLIRYRLQIKPGRWTRGIGGTLQQPEPRRKCCTCEAIDTPSIMCRTAASPFLFPPCCSAPASRRGVAPAGLCWAAEWSEEAAVTRSLSCLRTLTQCCHFHLPVTHFDFFWSWERQFGSTLAQTLDNSLLIYNTTLSV